MSQVFVELNIPTDLKTFKLPRALDVRLQSLLDKQDRDGRLSRAERQEAKALSELVDMLSLMKLRAKSAERRVGK